MTKINVLAKNKKIHRPKRLTQILAKPLYIINYVCDIKP